MSYQRDSVKNILTELRIDQTHYNKLYNSYKKCHRILLFLEFTCQSTNLACQSTSLVTLLTVTTIPVGLIFNVIGVITGGVGIFCRHLNHRKTKLMSKNRELLKISRHTERSIIGQCLNNEDITPEEYNLITTLIESYYEQKTVTEKRTK